MAKGAKGKQAEKKTKRVVEDKTFGLKNKNKSKKVQQYVKNVEQQASGGGKKGGFKAEEPRLTKKQTEAAKAAELALIFKPVIASQKVEEGADPKTIICQFFVQGTCKKGQKCRYSHDKTVVRKVNKIDIYNDGRTEEEKKKETMEKWNQEELEDVVRQKQGKENSNLGTNIVCKYFLEAIESQKYGWFWECPNGGGECKYRHALPPGFVLRQPGEARDEEKEEMSLEEILDEERRKLKERLAVTGGGTTVTLERFLVWRDKRREHKEEQRIKEEKEKKVSSKADRDFRKLLSGREMFVFKPDLFIDDDAAGDVDYTIESDEDEEIHVIEVTGTSLTRTVVVGGKVVGAENEEEKQAEEEQQVDEEKQVEEKKVDEKAARREKAAEKEAEESAVPINEELFEDDGIDDLSDDE